MNYENRHYVIFNTSELNLIDFNEVMEESSQTVIISVNGLQTFVKYDGPMPPSVYSLTTKSIEYTHDEILIILSTPEWEVPQVH